MVLLKYVQHDYLSSRQAHCVYRHILHRNQAGSSTGMEFLAFKLCMEHLIGLNLLITTFVSDRHTAIAKHMKEVLKKIIHYFDLWHIKKSKYSCNSKPWIHTKP